LGEETAEREDVEERGDAVSAVATVAGVEETIVFSCFFVDGKLLITLSDFGLTGVTSLVEDVGGSSSGASSPMTASNKSSST